MKRVDAEYISARLRALRAEKGKTMDEVAAAIGSSKQTIYDMENWRRKRPTINMLFKLAIYYETTLDDIVGLNRSDQ